MKDGCAPEGSCGACTVIVDGHAIVSCAQPAARIAGRSVETLEGLPDEIRSGWAGAFARTGASQCGFCSPGIVMKAEALLRRRPDPSAAEVTHALAGNLCRCTGYTSIVEAVLAAAGPRRAGDVKEAARADLGADPGGRGPSGHRPSDTTRASLRSVSNRSSPTCASPGCSTARSASPTTRARSSATSTSRARWPSRAWSRSSRPRDVPGKRCQGLIVDDWPLLVAEGETTHYVGDVLAAVAATTRAVARRAASLVDVDYDILEPVTDPFAALASDAPALHPGGNVVSRSVVRRGDAEAAIGSAAHVVTDSFRTQAIEHAFLEPESCLAVPGLSGLSGEGDAPARDGEAGEPFDAPAVHVWSQGQGAWEDRRQIASFLGLPERAVRVTQVATGGAFGGKEDLNVQGQAALLAIRTGRPVLLALSRRESLRFHVKRHPFWMTYTVACDADGRLVAVRARIVGDNGAYASVGGKVLERAAGHACGAYRVPNVDVEATAVYTNDPPSGAMRGFGANQANFALESLLDVLAERVGIDGWEMRWRNALETGDRFGTGQLLGPGVGLRKTLLAVRDAYRSARYAGIACAAKNTGIGNGMTEYGRAVLRAEPDGTLTLHHSWTEMGQGCHTVFRQIAATELGVDPGRIRVVVDTDHELDTGETTASRATMLGGRAVIEAAATPPRGAGRTGARRGGHRRPGRPGVRGRGRHRLDDADRGGGRARHALRVRLGDPGRHPRRRRADRAGGRSPRRRSRDQPHAARRAGRGRRAHGPRPGADRGVRHRGRRAADGDAQVARASSRRRGCRRSSASSSRSPSRRGRTAPRAWARPSWCPPRPPSRARCAASTASAGRASRCAIRPPHGRSCRGSRRAASPARRRSRAPVDDPRMTPSGPAVTPGLVDAHHHLYSALARGMPAPRSTPTTFRGILEQVWWRLDRALDLEMIAWSARLAALEALESGTTAIVDHHESPNAIEGSLSVIADACAEVGVRVVVRLRRQRPQRR